MNSQRLSELRQQAPLIHHLTNLVTINDVANVTLAIGARPVMAMDPEEAPEMAGLAGAVVLNLGTPSRDLVRAATLAAGAARGPVILDPVGAGATPFRTQLILEVAQTVHPAIIRANPGEVAGLLGENGAVSGVDSQREVSELTASARELAQNLGAVVAMTGPEDYVTDGERSYWIANGDPLLKSITGTGCMATACVGAFAALAIDPLEAAIVGLAAFGLAAEWAAGVASGPGSFKVALLDSVAALTPAVFDQGARIRPA